MKVFIKYNYLLLILFLLILGRTYFAKRKSQDLNVLLSDNEKFGYGYSNARLFYQNPYSFNENIYIFVTTPVQEKDYVVNNDGLVGIIKKVYDGYALVDLVSSSDFIAQVKINNCYGIYSSGTVTNINNTCSIKVGDIVETSELGYINKTVPIGTISSIKQDKNGINNSYPVLLNLNISNLNNFMIISRDRV